MTWVRLLVFTAGLGATAGVIFSALETFVLPRNISDRLTLTVFNTIRVLFVLPLKLARSYGSRDRVMAFYAPVSLLALVPTWYLLVALGYAAMFWGLGVRPLTQALVLSGSSLLTLGFSPPEGLPVTLLAFSESALGLLLVALLIAYLPSIYAAFQRRESAVTRLEVRAGDPPEATQMLLRYHRIHGLERLEEVWPEWEIWFSEIDESHTSLPGLVFFRSPAANHSWITAAGAILDTAAVYLSVVELPADPRAQLCIRSGYLALNHIADFFELPYPHNPHYPDQPISIRREEFEQVCQSLAQGGLPLKADRERAWQDFAGWRVNYDAALLGLCTLTLAPLAPWSSDRAEQSALPPFLVVHRMKLAGSSREDAAREGA